MYNASMFSLSLNDIILILIAVGIFVVVIWNIILERRLARLSRGSSNSLEELLGAALERNEQLTAWCEKLDVKHALRDQQFAASVKGVGLVRYNPYEETGPQQSFALALIDSHGDGVMLSSISARDKVRIFAKNIQKYAAEQEFTDEEKQALAHAKKDIDALTER
jgi:uncharacterized membrane protein YccC